jgi:hypothetical protein
MKQRKQLIRQGDVMFIPVKKLPAGERKQRADGAVAYGEVTGHSHRLAMEDQVQAEVLEIGGGVYVHVGEAGLSIKGGADFVHEEHGTVTLAPGDYEVRIQREYSPEEIRNVVD